MQQGQSAIRPALLTVDDDPEVLRAVERDLRRHYGRDYRVVRRRFGPSALEALDELQRRDEPVALLLVDQRMPQMTGVEFLEQARRPCPRRQAGAAHRLRRHRGRDPGDQRRSASTTTCSSRGTRPRSASTRCSTTCSTTGSRLPPAVRGHARRRAPLVAGRATRCATSWPATRCPTSGSTSSRSPRRSG